MLLSAELLMPLLLYCCIAQCQVIHFDLPTPSSSSSSSSRSSSSGFDGDDSNAVSLLEYCLNQMLPLDVRIFNIELAPPASAEQSAKGLPWHANLNATGKLYTYRLAVGSVLNPLESRQRAHYHPARHPVDLAVLEHVAM
jgi:tRNA U38,U39,U40 pseudouridine synthase TruA